MNTKSQTAEEKLDEILRLARLNTKALLHLTLRQANLSTRLEPSVDNFCNTIRCNTEIVSELSDTVNGWKGGEI